jgi:hypothetical protein
MLQPGFSDPGILRDHGILSSLMFLRVSVSPCLRVSVSPCLRVSVSPCLRVSVPPWWILSFIQ